MFCEIEHAILAYSLVQIQLQNASTQAMKAVSSFQQKMKAGSTFCIFVLCILYPRSRLIFGTTQLENKNIPV